ncbi:MAG TPA: PKD domain-containing protein [Myxococcaceae bacterium]
MLPPRPPSRLRAALLVSVPLALWMGCVPNLEGAQCETDQNCPSSQFCSAGTCKEGQRPQRTATMSATASLGTNTASVGQQLTLQFTVTNTGTIVLENIAPASVTAGGTAGGTIVSGPSPATVARLVPGASASFQWTVTMGAAGTLTFSATARGSASDTAEAVSASATSLPIAVQRPAQLEVGLSGPPTVSRGQVFAVTMTVTNRGDAPAQNVAPGTPTLTKTGGASATAGATPAPVTIAGGASVTFQLTFTENGTSSGTLVIKAAASGTDGNSNAAVTSAEGASGTVTVQRPAALAITSFTIPSTIGRGGTFSAVLTVSNTGEASANLVLPSPDPPAKTATSGADATTSTALTSGSIPGGGSRTFTWTFTETGTGTGTLKLSTGATGKEANTGQTITAPSTDSNVAQVQAGGALAVTSFTIPASLSRGQGFTAVLVVTNSGGSAVNNVTVTAPTTNATGGAAATTSTTFAPVSIAPGGNRTFTFNYTESGGGSGTLSFTSHATGTDSASMGTLTSSNATTNVAAVQQPAQLAITGFTLPPNLSRGQTFQASLTISNSGEAAALGVLPSPNPPQLTATGGAGATTSSTLTAQTIAGGASATFTWSYTENGTGTGTLRLATAATGTDANTGGTISTSSSNSNVAQVENPASLSVTSFTIPSAVLRGGTFTANLVVTNTGGAAASVVIPSPSPPSVAVTSGNAAASSSTTLTPVTIAGGANHTFSWTFTENGTGVGALQLSAAVTGQDANSGAALNVPTVGSNVIAVQNPGGLLITDFSFPTQLSRGQTFTVSMTVQNSGGSAVNSVVPSPDPPALNAGGAANATTSSTHAPVNLAPGAITTFTWTYTENGTGPGTLSFTGAAQGTGSVSGNPVNSGPSTTATAQVQTPATLSVTAADITAPVKVSRAQTFTVRMVVTNTGQATANAVVPTPLQPTVQRTGNANASTSTSPASQNIAGGASATFQWTFTENGTGTGTLKFTGGASGTDANSGAPANASAVQSAGTTTVQTPAALGITAFTQPALIQRGATFTLSLTVTNTGEADANLVIPSPNPPNQTTTGGVNATTSSAPAAVTVPGGANRTFTWSYTEDGSATGTLQFSAIATGQDANSGAALSTPSSNSNLATVQEPADLEITSFTLAPATLSVGQTFTASITVHNRGGTTANGVLPSPDPPTVTGTGGANASTSTALSSFTLAAGASRTYTWTFTESGGPGTIQLTSGATGTDSISGATLTAPQLSSAVTTVQSPAALTVTSFTLSRSVVSRGQAFTASMTVTNNGQAAANNVRPSPLQPTVIPTGNANATTPTSPAAQSIPGGGGTAVFTWSYTENGTGSGSLKLNGGASGTDANSGATASAPAVDSGTLTVQTPPALAVTSFTASPSPMLRGSGFTLTMVVSNSGQATANGVLPSPNPPALTPTGGANATTSSTQTPANITGGSNATFTWSYTENGTAAGTLRFAAMAAGTDANSGAPVTSSNANSNLVTVQAPANLVVTTFLTTPSIISRGQAFTATMLVQNQGGTTANGVLPSPNPPTVNTSDGVGPNTSTTLTPVAIPASGTAAFTWNYVEIGSGPGTFTLTAGATGTSAIGGTTVTAPAVTTSPVTVQEPASLSITAFVIPGPVGTSFTATLTVRNNGQATANNVLPTPQAPIVTGGVTATPNGSPSPQSIPGGSTTTFDLDYDVTGTGGTVQLVSGAVGTDANSAAAVTAADFTSNSASVPVHPPPDLGAALVVSPRVAAPGSVVTVTMEVKNGGLRPAKVAPPSELTLEGPAEVELVRAPEQRPAARVGPKDSQRFEWTYRAVRPGWVTFSGAAKGAERVTSRHLTVPAPWCAGATSLIADAGPAKSARCGASMALGGSPAAAGGAGRYRYEWAPEEGLSSALVANPTATPWVAATDYALTVTDADGCQAQAVARAEVTDAPAVALSVPERAAPGERVQLTRKLRCPAGGCVEAWELGDGRTSSVASPVARYRDEGVNTVRYRTTDASGCEATAELPVRVGGAAPPGGAK